MNVSTLAIEKSPAPKHLSFTNRGKKYMPDIDQIIAWESGEMDDQQEIKFFQGLVDTGLAWTLQGMYGRRAAQLIQEGDVHR